MLQGPACSQWYLGAGMRNDIPSASADLQLDRARREETANVDKVFEGTVDKRMNIPFQKLGAMVSYITSTWLPIAKEIGLELCLKIAAKDTNDLKAKTPSWQHIVNGSKYNSTLAKRQLLNCSASALGALTDKVETMLLNIKIVFDVSDEAEGDSEVFSEGQGIIDSAKLGLTVIAAICCIEQFSSKAEGPEMARSLLADKRHVVGLPAILQTKLRTLAAAKAA